MHKKMKKKTLLQIGNMEPQHAAEVKIQKISLIGTYLLPNISMTSGRHLFLVQTVIMLEVRMGRIEADIQD